MNIRRGTIWLANPDPATGGEINTTRPVVFDSNDVNNKNNTVVSVVPLTSNTTHVFSFEVLLPKGIANLPKESKVKTDQMRTLDKSRMIKLIGAVTDAYLHLIDAALRLHLKL